MDPLEIAEQEYRIWSIEHEAWWTQDSTGYTPHRSNAGVFGTEEALGICKDANEFSGSKTPNEAMVPVGDRED